MVEAPGDRDLRRLALAVLAAALLVLIVAGCGSSSSSSSTSTTSAQQKQLQAKLSSELSSGGSFQDPELVSCVTQQASKLSSAQLHALVNAAGDPIATKTGARLAATCLQQGRGVTAVRTLIAGDIEKAGSGTLPPEYTRCVAGKVQEISGSELATLFTQEESNPAAATAAGNRIGVALGRQCLGVPSVVAALRSKFLAPIEQGFRTSKFSKAFRTCVIDKAKAVPSSQVEQLALKPSQAYAAGEALGRKWAQQCIASGAKP